MANKRMFLVHGPTGQAVYLGKRMFRGWSDVPEDLSERLMRLFETVPFETQDVWSIDVTEGSGAEYRLVQPESVA